MTKGKLIALIATLVVVVLLGQAFWPLPTPTLVVSPQTTHFTKPLNADGTVDYVTAYNAHKRADVTPENNVAILLIDSVARTELDADSRPALLEALGLDPNDPDHTFVGFFDFVEAHAERYQPLVPTGGEAARRERLIAEGFDPNRLIYTGAFDGDLDDYSALQYDIAQERPWSHDELPMVADWLDANADVLDRLVAQSPVYDDCYLPAIPTGPLGMLVDASLGLKTASSRTLVKALRARIHQRIVAGELDAAWADAMAACRLGAAVSQQPGITALIGLAMDGVGVDGAATIATHGHLSVDQARRMLAEFDALPPLANTGERMIFEQRAVSLEQMQAAHSGTGTRGGAGGAISMLASIDVNQAMREINAYCDEFHDIATDPNLARRLNRLEQWDRGPQRLKTPSGGDVLLFLLSSSAHKRKVATDVVVNLQLDMMGSLARTGVLHLRYLMRADLARLALALAAYHAEYNRYPDELAALAPNYLPQVPPDLFTGGPLRYETDGESYRLWSVGEDGIDSDGDAAKALDDILIATPNAE